MPTPSPSDELLVLRRKPRITGWLSLGWRFVAMAALLGILILIHWIEREGLKDTHDGSVSFLDVIYFTMISATHDRLRRHRPGHRPDTHVRRDRSSRRSASSSC